MKWKPFDFENVYENGILYLPEKTSLLIFELINSSFEHIFWYTYVGSMSVVDGSLGVVSILNDGKECVSEFEYRTSRSKSVTLTREKVVLELGISIVSPSI